jgi:hypothetical protein
MEQVNDHTVTKYIHRHPDPLDVRIKLLQSKHLCSDLPTCPRPRIIRLQAPTETSRVRTKERTPLIIAARCMPPVICYCNPGKYAVLQRYTFVWNTLYCIVVMRTSRRSGQEHRILKELEKANGNWITGQYFLRTLCGMGVTH